MVDLNVPMTVAGVAGQRRTRLLVLLAAARAEQIDLTAGQLRAACLVHDPDLTLLEVEEALRELQQVGWVEPATWQITALGLQHMPASGRPA